MVWEQAKAAEGGMDFIEGQCWAGVAVLPDGAGGVEAACMGRE